MAQHDYDIANQSGANFRADLNNALDAIVSNNSGSSEPSTTFAYEWWIDTSANVLKLRNSANNAWITLPLSITADNSTSGALTVNGNLSTTGTLDVNGGEVILDADADTSITADTDDQIDFKIGNVDVATLTNSHLVLKGTTPKITIGDGGEEDTALIFDGNAQDFYIGLDDSADDLVIGKGSTVGTTPALSIDENLLSTFAGGVTVQGAFTSLGIDDNADATAITIDSSERVGINTTSPTSALQVVGGASVGSGFTQIRSGHPSFSITNGNTDTVYLSIAPHGGSFSTFMEIIDDDTDVNAIKFLTSNSERFRITSGGVVMVGRSVAVDSSREAAGTLVVGGAASGTSETLMQLKHGANINSTSRNYVLIYNDAGTIIGSITATSTATAFNQTSDYRLKENVNYEFNALSRVAQLKPARFNFIADKDTTVDGFIAHEVSDIVPQAVTGEKDGKDMQGIDQSKLVPLLTKAIQELEARVKTLEE